jgi:hypothetical protein
MRHEAPDEVRDFLERMRNADGPTSEQRARIHQLLQARLRTFGIPALAAPRMPSSAVERFHQLVSSLSQQTVARSVTGIFAVASLGVVVGAMLWVRAGSDAPELQTARGTSVPIVRPTTLQPTAAAAQPPKTLQPSAVTALPPSPLQPSAAAQSPTALRLLAAQRHQAFHPHAHADSPIRETRPHDSSVLPEARAPEVQAHANGAEVAAVSHAEPAASVSARSPDPTTADSGGSTRTLSEEVALIRAARRALWRGDAVESARQLDAHEARFLHGVLRPERQGLRLVLLCAAGPTPAVLESRDQFLREYPDSVLAGEVQRTCGAAQPRGWPR